MCMNNVIQFEVGKSYKGKKTYVVLSRTPQYITLDNGKRVKIKLHKLIDNQYVEQAEFKGIYSLYGMTYKEWELIDAQRLAEI